VSIFFDLLTAHCFSEFVFVIIVVAVFFFHDIQFDGIQTNDLQLNSTLFTVNNLALVHVSIDVHIGFAFRASSSRHLIYLQKTMSERAIFARCNLMKPANLTAGQNFLQHEILRGSLTVTISSEKQNFAHNVAPCFSAVRREIFMDAKLLLICDSAGARTQPRSCAYF